MQKCKVKSVRSLGRQKTYGLTMKSGQHNYALFDPQYHKAVISRNSHACAYTYISARQLWLKAHYPLEFYTAVLMCENKYEKIKVYKQDATRHKINVCGVHINKSKVSFAIADEKIYFGFANIKGIGEEVAKKIVAGQPYASFVDFLERFGTEAKVIKPLIALGVFEEPYDKETLYKFYEFYKKTKRGRKDSDKRYLESLEEYQRKLDELLLKYVDNPNNIPELNRFEESCYDLWAQQFSDMTVEEQYKFKGEQRTRTVPVYRKFADLRRRRETCITGHTTKKQDAEERPPAIEVFPSHTITLDKEICKILIDNKQAESEFYGFQWLSEVEESPEYKGLTIDQFETSGQPEGYIEVQVLKLETKVSKKGLEYKSLQVEDAMGKKIWITIWNDDYERFAEEMQPKQLIRIQVKPPSGGFPSFGFVAPMKHLRAKMLPQNKEDDMRIMLLPRKVRKVETIKAPSSNLDFELL